MVSLPSYPPPSAWNGHPNQTSIASMDEGPMVDNKCSKPLLISLTWQRCFSSGIKQPGTVHGCAIFWSLRTSRVKYRVYLQYDIRSKGKNQIIIPNSFKLRIMSVMSQLLWAMGQENWTRLIKSACFKDTPVTFQWRNLLWSRCVWSGVTPILCRAPWMDPDICRGIILDFQMVLHSICNVEPQTLCKRLDLDKTWQNLWAITLSTITMPILWTQKGRQHK